MTHIGSNNKENPQYDPYFDVCGGDVVWGGVEPVDGVDHAGVVHLA